MALVAFIEGHNQSGLPALGGQAIQAESIVSRVEGGGVKTPTAGFLSPVQTDQGRDAIMAVTVGDRQQEG
jgi:hypothetical protein